MRIIPLFAWSFLVSVSLTAAGCEDQKPEARYRAAEPAAKEANAEKTEKVAVDDTTKPSSATKSEPEKPVEEKPKEPEKPAPPPLADSKLGWDGTTFIGTTTMALVPME